MNRQETLQVLIVLNTAYPLIANKKNPKEMQDIVTLWTNAFAASPADCVQKAVDHIINTRTDSVPPTIGLVKQTIGELRMKSIPSAEEAWLQVKKAIRNSTYNAIKEYEKLPAIIRDVVVGSGTLRSWALSDESNTDTFTRNQFIKDYNARYNQYVNQAAESPEVVKQLMEPISKPTQKLPSAASPLISPAYANIEEVPVATAEQIEQFRADYQKWQENQFEERRAAVLAQLQINRGKHNTTQL